MNRFPAREKKSFENDAAYRAEHTPLFTPQNGEINNYLVWWWDC